MVGTGSYGLSTYGAKHFLTKCLFADGACVPDSCRLFMRGRPRLVCLGGSGKPVVVMGLTQHLADVCNTFCHKMWWLTLDEQLVSFLGSIPIVCAPHQQVWFTKGLAGEHCNNRFGRHSHHDCVCLVSFSKF